MAENTFLGLQPYTEDDAYRFKGRTEESQELFRLIVRNDFTVCYAESGEGKTSLLNAGVFPLLRENMYFPIAITFTSDDYKVTPDSFDAIIDRCIKDSIAEYNEKNKGINVEYKLCSTDFQGLDSQEELQRELSKYSWWKLRNYKPQAMGLTFTPVFVFDQFEEVFNLPGSVVWTKKFFDWLEDVSSDSCPDEVAQKVRGIIGDKAAFPTIKEEKGFKTVFSLRKEFIGELDYWGMQTHFIPALKDNRYCLKALTYEGAKKVMTQQVRFEENKVEQVLTYFVGQYSREPQRTIEENLPVIPALLLSVVCDSWEKDINYFSDIDTNGIEHSLNKILEKFYEEAIDNIVREFIRAWNEKSKQLATSSPWYGIQELDAQFYRDEIEDILFVLVDRNGKRERTKTTSTRFSKIGFDEKYKNILSDSRIIKVTKIDGEDYVEIVHDSLCPIIAKRKEIKLAEEARIRENDLLHEQSTKMWRRMSILIIASVFAIGFMAFLFWQNSRYLIAQQSLTQSEQQKDSVSSLNNKLNHQIEINIGQKDSITRLNESLSKQLNIIECQKDSLIGYLSIMNRLNQSLNNQMGIINLKNDSLARTILLNQRLYHSIHAAYALNRKKTDSLERVLLILTNQEEYISNTETMRDIDDMIDADVAVGVNACLTIRSVIEKKDNILLIDANRQLKACNPLFFNGFKCIDEVETSIKGHFQYNPEYIEKLIMQKDVSSFVEKESINRSILRSNKGLFFKNCCVRANRSTKYSFLSRGHQEIGVVAEVGGLITTRLFDKTHKKWYNDVQDVKKGRPSRFLSVDLPDSENSVLVLEVINTSNNDISFVVISN